MDLIIFKKNEVLIDFFDCLEPYKYIEYSNISELDNPLC